MWAVIIEGRFWSSISPSTMQPMVCAWSRSYARAFRKKPPYITCGWSDVVKVRLR